MVPCGTVQIRRAPELTDSQLRLADTNLVPGRPLWPLRGVIYAGAAESAPSVSR